MIRLLLPPALVAALTLALTACEDAPVPDRAAQALECQDDRAYQRGTGDDDTDPADPADDAEAALERWLEHSVSPPSVWADDLEQSAETDDRALWVREFEGREIFAVVVVDGETMAGEQGWYVDTWAMCDPALFPEEETEAAGIGIWTDTNGYRQPVDEVQTLTGGEQCAWRGIDAVFVGGYDGRAYYRDAEGVMQRWLATSYAADVEVPDDAEDTGWSRAGRRLWLADDEAYLVGEDGRAERWPGETEPIRCL